MLLVLFLLNGAWWLLLNYRRGAWQLLELKLMPDDPVRSAWVSIGIGVVIFTLFFVDQVVRREHGRASLVLLNGLTYSANSVPATSHIPVRSPRPPTLHESIFHTFLLVLVGFATICYWRGLWDLQDLYIMPDRPVQSNVLSLMVGLVGLFFMRSLRSTHGQPFLNSVDVGYFNIFNPSEPARPLQWETIDSFSMARDRQKREHAQMALAASEASQRLPGIAPLEMPAFGLARIKMEPDLGEDIFESQIS
ncbi:uncharacterized protein MONBRDRAFT_35394 [Monosiga brevicollis MX1]|uniref:Uncharacterized protein n=1 Tax=Monosiga brevicollis TaxID=81824 RepID=A9UNR0_MONBE|nr:uncharacterized protein MONBRDRAFT_35394 [Monosiga brevicollis MX1]EDQ92743.1 predicted protein [Monosiga brevicollis MX1]|eukprot:XP_001742505.1 hypothetical protein [Monosiga brevicollis MX1]